VVYLHFGNKIGENRKREKPKWFRLILRRNRGGVAGSKLSIVPRSERSHPGPVKDVEAKTRYVHGTCVRADATAITTLSCAAQCCRGDETIKKLRRRVKCLTTRLCIFTARQQRYKIGPRLLMISDNYYEVAYALSIGTEINDLGWSMILNGLVD